MMLGVLDATGAACANVLMVFEVLVMLRVTRGAGGVGHCGRWWC